MAELVQIIDEAARTGASLPVVAIDGMPGVGKTAFAIHAAHQLTNRFPDAQLYVKLQGHSATGGPLAPADVLATLLSSIGKQAGEIPTSTDARATTEARAAVWRACLRDLRTIVVLDDAAGHGHIESLLPNAPRSLVLVTSRRRLIALPARALTIDPMDSERAVRLFRRLVRLDGDRAAVEEVVRLCGYLPLAIAVVAGRMTHHSAWTVTDLAHRLRRATNRLEELKAEDVAVAAAFELSYSHLARDQQRFFRRLGAHPGGELEPRAAAALTATTTEVARQTLDALYADHLLEEVAFERYRLHDLLRSYARQLMRAAEVEQATGRLYASYLQAATVANRLVARRITVETAVSADESAEGLDLSTREQALSWLLLERTNLFACVDQARDQGEDATVLAFTSGLVWILRHAGPWDQAIALQEMAVAAATRLGDNRALGWALLELGVVRRRLGDLSASEATLRHTIDLLSTTNDDRGEGNARNELGVTHRLLGHLAEALDSHRTALVLFSRLGDGLGVARSRNYLGIALAANGSLPDSIECHQIAIEAFHQLGDAHGEADARNRLGVALRGQDKLKAAAAEQLAALNMFSDLGDRHGRATALTELGATLTQSGDFVGAENALLEAYDVHRAYGSQHGLAEVLNNRGILALQVGHPDRAREDFEEALSLARAIRLAYEEGRALEGLARCVDQSDGDSAKALRAAALAIYERLPSPRAALLRSELI